MGRLTIAAVAVAVLLPLVGSSVPPLIDYPDHLARMLILFRLQTEPAIAEVFAADWHFIPNLAMEAVVLPLAHVLPLELAGRVYIAVAMLLPVAGCAALHRALHPRVGPTPWPLAASLLACNAVVTTGLLGFAVGTGAALVASAILLRRSRPHVAALLGVVVFTCHAVAFVLLLVVLGSALAYRRIGWRRMAITLLPLVLGPLTLFTAFGSHDRHVDFAAAAAALLQAGPGLEVRLLWLFAPFASPGGWPYLDVPVLALFAAILIGARGRLGLAPEVLPALLALAAAWAILPDDLLGDGLMFKRMAWPAALLAIAGTDPRLPRTAAVPAAALCTLLLLVRGIVAGDEWAAQNARLADLRTALAGVPSGARVLAVRDGAELWHADPDEGLGSQAFHKAVAYARLPALPIAEHAAIWPMMFTEPGKSPLRFRAPYDRLAQHDGPLPLTSMLSAPPPQPLPDTEIAQLEDWRHRYDYVLRLHPRSAFEDPSLAEEATTNFAVLYRIRPASALAAAATPDAQRRLQAVSRTGSPDRR